jgi:hypothetical protein
MNPNEYLLVDSGKLTIVTALPVDLWKLLGNGKKLISFTGKSWAEEIDSRTGLPKWVKLTK